MNRDLIELLQKRLQENYEAYIQSLRKLTPTELIALAPEIADRKFVYDSLPEQCTYADAERLLHFADPLKLACDLWAAERTSDYSDVFEDLLCIIQDNEDAFYSEYPPVGVSKARTNPKSKKENGYER